MFRTLLFVVSFPRPKVSKAVANLNTITLATYLFRGSRAWEGPLSWPNAWRIKNATMRSRVRSMIHHEAQ
jgi:hypothetical protein